MHRLAVSPSCRVPCASCLGCSTRRPAASLQQALDHADKPELLLGGGDATAWPSLHAFLQANARRATPQRVWLEAPAASLDHETLEKLALGGVHGVLVQIEGLGAEMLRALRAGDGERAIADAEALGLATQARIVVRPKTFPIVAPLARRLAPRIVWLEIVRQDWGKPEVAMHPEVVSKLLRIAPNLHFSAHRAGDRGYLPPCALPDVWEQRPVVWRTTFKALTPLAEGAANGTYAACAGCGLRDRCQFADADALDAEARATLAPVAKGPLPWDRPRTAHNPVPASIVRARPKDGDVICTTPWTTMEVVDPDGKVRQCCSTWTRGDRGNIASPGSSLLGVWNGPGFQAARRAMAKKTLDELCLPICSRLHDEKFSERALTIQEGSEPFVANQLLLAEEIARRAEIVRSKPLKLALCPSTYCNYDCIMCDLGRTPRRELPESIWDEVESLLPTLQSLTLLGGEPLANPATMRFLQSFDVARTPDVAIDFVTNGSLLGEKTLRRMSRCTIGDVTVSLNAGTAEAYERVQRGIALEEVHRNIDDLIEFRRNHHRWFGITLSFVVQPAASQTLVAFGEFAHARNLRVRLMALNPEQHEGLDFYSDEATVLRVLADVDRFAAYAERVRPEWLREIGAARAGLLGEASARRRGQPPSVNAGARRLVVLP